MQKIKRNIIYLCLINLLLFTITPGAIASTYLEVGTGYRKGDFGTPTSSSLYDVSATIGYIAPDYDFGVTIPYLYATNKTVGQSDSQDGIGDIITRAGFMFAKEKKAGISLYGGLSVKIPTADSDNGLGTGKADYGAVLSASRHLKKIKISAMGGYVIVGDSSVQDYNDIYLYGVGVSKVFGRTGISTSFEGRRSLISGDNDPKDITLGIFHVINAKYSVRGGISYGLNNGGPDYGLNFALAHWF